MRDSPRTAKSVNERQSYRLQSERLQRQRNIRENLCRSVERKQENL